MCTETKSPFADTKLFGGSEKTADSSLGDKEQPWPWGLLDPVEQEFAPLDLLRA